MRILICLAITVFGSCQIVFGQGDSTKRLSKIPNFNQPSRLTSPSQRISRDSALVYMDGKFYSINEFDKLGSKFKSVRFLQNSDSIAAFSAKKLKVIMVIERD
jgi:hypothetical protein